MKITIALPSYSNQRIGGYAVHYTYANMLAELGHRVTIVFPRYLDPSAGIRARIKTPIWAASLRLKNRPLLPFPIAPSVKIRFLRNLAPDALPDGDVLVATAWQTAEAMEEAPARCGRKFYIVYDYEHLMTASPTIAARIRRTYGLNYRLISTSSIVA